MYCALRTAYLFIGDIIKLGNVLSDDETVKSHSKA
jgi:hypothetical protein